MPRKIIGDRLDKGGEGGVEKKTTEKKHSRQKSDDKTWTRALEKNPEQSKQS